MKRLGAILRADQGGLGVLSEEFARHLHPDAALVVELPQSRGEYRPERIKEHVGEIRECGNPLTPGDIAWLLERCDVLYCVETFYSKTLYEKCRAAGVRLILHAMPELYRNDEADDVWNPTTYDAQRLPNLVPVPVARDRLPYRQRTEARTFLHVAAPAMHDRNGTDLVIAALEHVTEECQFVLAGWSGVMTDMLRRLTNASPSVHFIERGPVDDYWQRYTDDIDVLLLPRRYAGLSLLAQEAASCGIPTVCLDVPPLNAWCWSVGPVGSSLMGQFAGGRFPVWTCDPRDLAKEMDRLIREPALVSFLSQRADRWADSISWHRWQVGYRMLLEMEDG